MSEKKLIQKLEAADLIAIILIVGGFILSAFKTDQMVSEMLVAICFYYFGKKGRTPINPANP